MNATVLMESYTKTVLDVQPTPKWRHDTAVGPQVARRNAGNLLSLIADKGYGKNAFHEWLRDYHVRPLIRRCLYAVFDHAHSARLDNGMYTLQWITET